MQRLSIFRRILAGVLITLALTGLSPAPAAPPPDGSTREMVTDLEQTLAASVKAEEKTLKTYEERLSRAKQEQIYLAAAVNGYQLQLSTFANLLLSAGVDIAVLQKTRAEIKSSLVEIQKMTEGMVPAADAITNEKKNLEQQKELISRQIGELSGLKAKNRNPPAATLEKTARKLAALLSEKESLIVKLDKIYRRHLSDFEKLTRSLSDLAGQYDTAIEQRKAKNLFERQQVFRFDGLRMVREDAAHLITQLKRFLVPGEWLKGFQALWQSAGPPVLSIVIVLYGVMALMVRIKKSVLQEQIAVKARELGPWNRLAALLAEYSVIPGGIALTLFIYSSLDTMYPAAAILRGGALVLLIFLSIRWMESALSGPGQALAGGELQAKRLVRLSRGIGIFSLIYLPLAAVLGEEGALLVVFRLAGTLWLLAWTLITWRHTRFLTPSSQKKKREENRTAPQGEGQDRNKDRDQTDNRKDEMVKHGCKTLLTLISCGTLILDMAGYASLSLHWLLSWAQTVAIVFWWWILLAMLREWDAYYRQKSTARRNELLYDDYPVQWLVIRAAQLIWLVTLAAALLLAWGNSQTVLNRVYEILAHPLAVGNMNFSLMGLFYAVLVILITYALTRIWKWIFQHKFLNKSGMEIGLQASITSITSYTIWTFGILVALHVFGLNTASLAVAFGALGIGLGFGLQNIFNNFISGIILLFERPIQVGDDIEINGTWARVQKINVRSTVVQTYDNASLIIPNADLISSQVTNWSFKDKRIRRSVTVGVAYGSDIQLVRDCLLDIAGRVPKVLKYPQPDVLFRDFGDSALIFRLRIWTDIDHMLTVETEIRFEIDRVFREQAIEISFPQRDIHIRSGPGIPGSAT